MPCHDMDNEPQKRKIAQDVDKLALKLNFRTSHLACTKEEKMFKFYEYPFFSSKTNINEKIIFIVVT